MHNSEGKDDIDSKNRIHDMNTKSTILEDNPVISPAGPGPHSMFNGSTLSLNGPASMLNTSLNGLNGASSIMSLGPRSITGGTRV